MKAVESWSRPDFFFGLRSVAFIGRVAARVSSARALRRATAAATVVGGTEICRRQRAAAPRLFRASVRCPLFHPPSAPPLECRTRLIGAPLPRGAGTLIPPLTSSQTRPPPRTTPTPAFPRTHATFYVATTSSEAQEGPAAAVAGQRACLTLFTLPHSL